MVQIREYVDDRGRSPFRRWHEKLDQETAERVGIALNRMREGNFSSMRGLGGGLLECRLHFGPGYRIYFGRDGHALVILLAGGTKASQHRDIDKARERWRDYRRPGR